jgi:hypothetical protein
MSKVQAIAHSEIEPSTTLAYKIGGRWYWVTELDQVLPSGSRFVTTVPVAKDPRYAQIGHSRLRYIGGHDTVLVRAQDAPVFEWVTKKLERLDAAHCRNHLEFRSDCYSCRTEREFTN